MNNQNQSPLIPQGSLLEQKNQGRARVKIAVSIVLAVHGIGLVALLMQGCQKEKEPAQPAATQEETTSNAAPALETPSNTAPATATDTNPVTPPSTGPATPPPPETPPAAAAATDYKIVSGDTLSGIAKKNHISTKALMDANPGVDPTKLQIGQVIHVPPPPPPSASSTTSGTAAPETANGEKLYEVKSGDTLSTIAHTHGTTVRALRSANNLKTDRIVVGQKLKLPAKATPPASTATNPPAQ